MKRYILLLTFICVSTVNSQTLRLLDIDSTNFPIMSAKFYAWDANWKQIRNIAANDFVITENSEPREILSLSCPEPKPTDAISAVIMIERSGSMQGEMLELAKIAARGWVAAMPKGKGEAAICSFDLGNYLNQDFTSDKTKLITAIDSLSIGGGSSFDAGFIDPVAGALVVAENAKHRPVIIFISEGYSSGSESAIINKARSVNAVVYCIAIGISCPPILQNVALHTGGSFFEKITTRKQAQEVYSQLTALSQGNRPCTIEWMTKKRCEKVDTEISLLLLNNGSSDTKIISFPDNGIVELSLEPSFIHFRNNAPGMTYDTNIVIKARNNDYEILSVKSSNSAFRVFPQKINIHKGESVTFTLQYTPTDSSFSWADIIFAGDICDEAFFCSGGFDGKEPERTTLELIHPNGGEVFMTGADTLIRWKGVRKSEKVGINFSSDNGKTWINLSGVARDFSYKWHYIPGPESDECLIEIYNYNQEIDSCVVQWYKCYGGNNSESLQSIVQNLDGSYLLAGNTDSNDGQVHGAKGKTDIWIVKIDRNGNIQWDKCFGGSEYDHVQEVQRTYDDGWIIIGETSSSDFDVKINRGSYDCWVIKLDKYGNMEWQRTFGGSEDDEGVSVKQCYDMGYVVAGYTRSSDFDVSNNLGSTDFWIVKLNSKGDIVWEKSIGGSGGEYSRDIELTSDNGFVVTGSTNSSDGDIKYSNGGTDIWVVKLNCSGDIEWERTLGGSNTDYAFSIKETTDLGFIVGGTTTSNDNNIDNHGDSDYWLVKLNSNGIKEWDKCYGGEKYERMESISLAYDGGYILAGRSNSDDSNVSDNNGKYDFWIVKVDNNGNLEWEKCLGGKRDEYNNCIIQSHDGGYILGGYTESQDENVQKKYFGDDFWLVKLGQDIGEISQRDTSDNTFSIVVPECTGKNVIMGAEFTGKTKVKMENGFLHNSGRYPVHIDTITFSGSDASRFGTVPGYTPVLIEPGKLAPVEFTFSPLTPGPKSAIINLHYQSGSATYTISGAGEQEELISNFGVGSAPLDFGYVNINTEKKYDTALVWNSSSSTITIDSTIMMGPDKTQFVIESGGGSQTLAPGDSLYMAIKFKPYNIGRTSGSIGFYYNSRPAPVMALLYGRGTGWKLIVPNDSAYAGDKFNIVVDEADDKLDSISKEFDSFSIRLFMDKTLLAPVDAALYDSSDANYCYITYSGAINPQSGRLAEIPVVAGLGKESYTYICIEDIIWFRDDMAIKFDIERIPGRFTLLGICPDGGRRLINPNSHIAFKQIMPNPSNDKVKLEFELTETGATEIVVSNSLGQLVMAYPVNPVIGVNSIEMDTSGLSSGQYFVQLRTPTHVAVQSLVIRK